MRLTRDHSGYLENLGSTPPEIRPWVVPYPTIASKATTLESYMANATRLL